MCAVEPGRSDPIDVEAIERKAEQALAAVPGYVWDGRTLPVPVEEIVDSVYCLRVRDVDDLNGAPGSPPMLSTDQLSGLLLTGRGEIWVNAGEARKWPARRRFTIGHELGHWVLHRTGQQSLFCRTGDIGYAERPAPPASTRPPVPVTEEEADAFAAALLMPRALVAREHATAGGDVQSLMATFGCSFKAMSKRLEAVTAV